VPRPGDSDNSNGKGNGKGDGNDDESNEAGDVEDGSGESEEDGSSGKGKGAGASEKATGSSLAGGKGKKMQFGSTEAQILGKSGKITLSGIGSSDNETITVGVKSVCEKDADGNRVGQAGPASGKHCIQSLATADGSFGDFEQTTVSGLDALAVSWSSSLFENAKLTVTIFLFEEGGEISPTGNDYTVSNGSVKFNIEVDNWPFCDGADGLPCQGGVGEFLDVEVTVQGPNLAANGSEAQAGTVITLGNAELVLDDQQRLDGGDWTGMPSGYPSVGASGNTYFFTFRFDKFDSKAEYDPVVRPAQLSVTGIIIVVVVVVVVVAVLIGLAVFLIRRRRAK